MLIGQNIFVSFLKEVILSQFVFETFWPLLHSNSCTISFRIAKISLVWQQGLKLRWNIDVRFHLRLEFQIEDQLFEFSIRANKISPHVSDQDQFCINWQNITRSLDNLKLLRRNDKWEQFPLPKEAGWTILVDSEF